MKKVNVNDLKLAGNRSKPGAYAAIFAELEGLRPGEALTLPAPKDIDLRTAQNRLGSALRHSAPAAPAGHRWATRSLEGGGLAICAVPVKAAKKKKAKRKR